MVTLRFPSGRSAEEVVPRDPAALAWMANLACLELHPHSVRAEDLDHPDELRVDLDPASMLAGEPGSSCRRVMSAMVWGMRTPKYPLVEIGRAERKADALAGLERWKRRHPDVAARLAAPDVLVDSMRGRYRTWTRIRVNLQRVPVALRPAPEALDPDEGPENRHGVSARTAQRRTPSRARRPL